ncbi:MAG TPA: TrkA C-terminal domain-containing protein, partial [Chloroflexia bacterium]|nr:TrkA C-terminal domain-containing protein [Chloroflexia bacterium]
GVDVTVSQTNVILSLIEQLIPDRPMVHLTTLKHDQMAIVETVVSEDSMVAGLPLHSVKLPANVVISAVLRDNDLMIPNGDTTLLAGDEVIAIAQRSSEVPLRRLLAGS